MKNGYPVQNVSVRNGYRSKTWLSEVGTWPKLGCQKWSPDRNSSVKYGHLTNEQGTISHRHVLVRWPYLTDEFWSGDHFWQPSFGRVPTSDSRVLVRWPFLTDTYWTGYPFFTDDYYENVGKKLKLKLKERFLKLGTMLIIFLGIFYVIYVKIAPTDTIPLNCPLLYIALLGPNQAFSGPSNTFVWCRGQILSV